MHDNGSTLMLDAACAEVDAGVQAWRATATHIVAAVMVAVGLPALVWAVLVGAHVLTLAEKWIAVTVYVTAASALLIPRRRYRWRAAILLITLYVLAGQQLVLHGLPGDGRIAVLVLPLLALILPGVRKGWMAAAVTVALLAAYTVLAWNGTLARWADPIENAVQPGYRLLQVLLLLAAFIPLMVLFTRFPRLQTQTMIAERHARLDLEYESARRRRLQSEIIRISEEERRRVGSELHDGLCQQLTAALLHCAAVENQLSGRNCRSQDRPAGFAP